jgi:hypothetical protein
MTGDLLRALKNQMVRGLSDESALTEPWLERGYAVLGESEQHKRAGDGLGTPQR